MATALYWFDSIDEIDANRMKAHGIWYYATAIGTTRREESGINSMHVYTSDIMTAAITFPFIALIMTMPYMIYQYRKFGSIPWLRTLIVYSMVFYLLCAYFLVILPLPQDHSIVIPYAQNPQLMPFNFVREFLAETSFQVTDPSTWLGTLKDPFVYEAIFNGAILVPLGMYLHYYFRRTWWQTLIIGFCVTLFFEVSQLTGLFGIYAHPYRLFDVDDLICNTLGALVGFLIVIPAMRVLPDIRLVNEEAREEGVRASLIRRVLAFALDLIFAAITAIALAFFFVFFGANNALADIGASDSLIAFCSANVPLVLFFIAIPLITKGQTLGQMILKLAIVRPDASPARWYQYFTRYGLLYLFIAMPAQIFTRLDDIGAPTSGEFSALVGFIAEARPILLVAFGIGLAVWLISIVVRAVRSRKSDTLLVLLHEHLSGTRCMTLEGIDQMRDRTIVLSVDQVQKLEQMIDAGGTSLAELMKRAGHSVSDALIKRHPDPVPVAVLCGTGNNGGDGWIVAGDLAARGYPVTVLSPLIAEHITVEPARTAAIEIFSSASEQGLPLRVIVSPDADDLEREIQSADVLVDGLLGTGFAGGTLREPYASWIDAINARTQADSKVAVLSIDVPSGYSAQTGIAGDPCVKADVTITMLAYKPGLITKQAEQHCGDILLAKIADIRPYLDRLEAMYPTRIKNGKDGSIGKHGKRGKTHS